MSKEKKNIAQSATTPVPEVVLTPEVTPEPSVPVMPPTPNMVQAPVQKEKLLEVDRLTLELARQQRQTALAEARTALANNEKSELAYKYVVLQLYMKYSLTEADAISETGDIIRGGALQKAPNS